MSTLSQCLPHRSVPVVEGASKDHRDFAAQLERINELLEKTGTEEALIRAAVERLPKKKEGRHGWLDRFRGTVAFQIRCTLLRKFLGMDYRAFSVNGQRQCHDPMVLAHRADRGLRGHGAREWPFEKSVGAI
jgi:hypothetical protein